MNQIIKVKWMTADLVYPHLCELCKHNEEFTVLSGSPLSSQTTGYLIFSLITFQDDDDRCAMLSSSSSQNTHNPFRLQCWRMLLSIYSVTIFLPESFSNFLHQLFQPTNSLLNHVCKSLKAYIKYCIRGGYDGAGASFTSIN